MLRRTIISILLSVVVVFSVSAWGQKGHDIIACVAQRHLSAEAQVEVDRLLSGYTMVYWSNWADSAKYTKEYEYTAPWHYRNVEEGETPDSTPTPKEGDVVWAVREMIAQLEDSTLSEDEHAFALKLLIHLVGDLHCPMHAGRKSDLGGNRVPMVFFYNATNLHSIWDSGLIYKVHDWSYTEWALQIDRLSVQEQQYVVSGDLNDWFSESYAIAVDIYKDAKRNKEINYDYRDKYQIALETQLRNGGLRLAHILNKINFAK
ncbi:MAG: S1/P1 nuclease [Rikenellaceae bacterium]